MIEKKLSKILNLLQESYKISIKNEYEEVQEYLLSSIVELKNIISSELFPQEGEKMIKYKDEKDRSKFIINYKLTDNHSKPLPKRRIPEKVFEYLIKNNLLKDQHFGYFQKNNFREGQFSSFTRQSGDLITQEELIPETEKHRYIKFMINDKEYYAIGEWNKPSIDRFNAYIHSNFENYIVIKEVN